MKTNSIVAALAASVCVIALATPAQAQQRQFNIPAGSLKAALDAYGRQSGRPIIYRSEEVRRAKSNGYQGSAVPEDALQAILSGTGFTFNATSGGAIAIRSGEAEAGSAAAASESADITVTGSRIRGAPIASPVIVLDHHAMEERGQTTLGDVIRSLPQAFGGGQNPGVAISVPTVSGVNVGGASTANLRGLGSDATLTLLNGHRLAYNASRQGIDLSSIPFGMVDRVEVVADGASALYGSDAVAGVVNIILKRDYEGLQVSADLGGSTDGGDFQQQYGVVTGHKWSTGGIVAAYEYGQNTGIFSQQRSFAAGRPNIELYPAMHHHAAALSAHQVLTDTLTFEMDALYNKRWTFRSVTLSSDGSFDVSHQDTLASSRSFAIAPSLKLRAGKDWQIVLSGVYGTETVHDTNNVYAGSVLAGVYPTCWCNTGKSVELAANGRLLELPAGPVSLAAGAGYRINSMNYFNGAGATNNFVGSQSSTYAYGEINVPVISPAQGISAIDQLNLSAALRYERYPTIGSVATPKLGIIYAPVADIKIKGSWGRSFRAPTLYQQHQGIFAVLYTAASRGGSGYSSTATALYVGGGNANLKPERAESWSATVDYAPHQVPGLHLQASYFSTIYKDRIVIPITYTAQSLSLPAYATFSDRSPTVSKVSSIIDAASSFDNYVGDTFDPSDVAAIIYNTNVNAGRQSIHGVDLLVDYKTSLGQGAGNLGLNGNLAYLASRQQLIAGAANADMAGTLYNPPHWRGHASVNWERGGLTLNATTTVIGGVTDIRAATPIRLGGMVTQDFTARYAFGQTGGPLHGLTLSLTVQNLLNDKPPVIATSAFYETPFDSTNYSSVGRYIGVGVIKSW